MSVVSVSWCCFTYNPQKLLIVNVSISILITFIDNCLNIFIFYCFSQLMRHFCQTFQCYHFIIWVFNTVKTLFYFLFCVCIVLLSKIYFTNLAVITLKKSSRRMRPLPLLSTHEIIFNSY